MTMATVSLLGLYRTDPSLFDSFSLPESVNKTTLTNQILMETAELEVVYPSAPAMKDAIAMWSAANVENWAKLAEIYKLQYDPIENYDRNEEWDDTGTVGNTSSTTTSNNYSETQDTTGSTKPQVQVQENVWGFNSATNVPKSNQITSGSTDTTGKNTATGTSSGEGSNNTTETRALNRKGRVHGNIGVTTSQQMIESEIALWDKFNIYDFITQAFRKRFCLLIY